jgi:hypothetical protein
MENATMWIIGAIPKCLKGQYKWSFFWMNEHQDCMHWLRHDYNKT